MGIVTTMQRISAKKAAIRALNNAVDGADAMKEKSARLGRLLGVGYLLLTETMDLIDEAELMMDRDFRAKAGFKHAVKGMNLQFRKFYDAIVPHIEQEEFKRFSADIKALDENVRSWANLAGYKKASEEDICENLKARAKNLHLDFIDKCAEIQERFGKEEVETFLEELKIYDIKEV